MSKIARILIACVLASVMSFVSCKDDDDEYVESETFIVNGVTFDMVFVEGGGFKMGGTSEQGRECRDDEFPICRKTVDDFYIGETEVTQALWKAVMGNNPSSVRGADLPVENVSWYECQSFISRLNMLTGLEFHLPTETEWEYAARGGDRSRGYMYSGSDSIENVAWYFNNSLTLRDVTSKKPNEAGLYGMSGNASEWCDDRYGPYGGDVSTSEAVCRGGNYMSESGMCRVSSRGHHPFTDDNLKGIGFRLVLYSLNIPEDEDYDDSEK